MGQCHTRLTPASSVRVKQRESFSLIFYPNHKFPPPIPPPDCPLPRSIYPADVTIKNDSRCQRSFRPTLPSPISPTRKSSTITTHSTTLGHTQVTLFLIRLQLVPWSDNPPASQKYPRLKFLQWRNFLETSQKIVVEMYV